MLDQEIIDKIPFDILSVEPIVFNYYRLYAYNAVYLLRRISKQEEKLLWYYAKISKHVNIPIHTFEYHKQMYVVFQDSTHMEEELACSKLLLDECVKIFEKTKEAKTLKKIDMKSMQKTYPILDKYFLKLEYLIREIEVKRPRTDYDWLLLSKYHIILAAKMNLSQIQNKLFKLMEEEVAVEVGLALKYPNALFYRNAKINFYLESFICPISEFLARFYLENNHLGDFKTKLDDLFNEFDSSFYKLHFSFIVLYVYILNLNDINISDVLYATKFNELCLKIQQFNFIYKDYFL